MTSEVTVNMRTCSKVHHVKVSMRDDGNMDVEITSDCAHVQDYAKRLTEITMEDATDFCTSKINAPEIRQALSATCLCPVAVMNAAWMECGMLSKNMCRKAGSNDIVLDPDKQG
ncbi:MAG: hypothetical protein Q4Q58_05785 [Thermoplasmata archaeon]|nr:hypothetical protein [Thermoplasmata archaeon]